LFAAKAAPTFTVVQIKTTKHAFASVANNYRINPLSLVKTLLFFTCSLAAGKPGVAGHMNTDNPGSSMALPQGVDNSGVADSSGDHCLSFGSSNRVDHPMDRTGSRGMPAHLLTRIQAVSTRRPA